MDALRTVHNTVVTSTGFASLVLVAGALMFMLMITASLRIKQDGD